VNHLMFYLCTTLTINDSSNNSNWLCLTCVWTISGSGNKINGVKIIISFLVFLLIKSHFAIFSNFDYLSIHVDN
jgi:hypothetical protein